MNYVHFFSPLLSSPLAQDYNVHELRHVQYS